MFLVDWAVKMRIRPPEFETSICDAKYHVSLSTRSVLGKCVYLVTLAMSLFDLQDVCIAIGSIATLDLPMVVDLIGIYGLKGPKSSRLPPFSAAAAANLRRKFVSGRFDEENPFVQNSSVLLVQPDEGVSVLVVDRIGDYLPQSTEKSRVLVIPVGARNKCQQENLISGIPCSTTMASIFFVNSYQINFESVLMIPDHDGMLNMFKALEASGLRGNLGCDSVLYEKELEQFFETALVQGEDITGAVSGKFFSISQAQFAHVFALPTEGLVNFSEGPDFCKSSFRLSLFLDHKKMPEPVIDHILVPHVLVIEPIQYWEAAPCLIRAWQWTKRIHDSNCEILSKVNAVEIGVREALLKQHALLRQSLQDACRVQERQGVTQAMQINYLKKGWFAGFSRHCFSRFNGDQEGSERARCQDHCFGYTGYILAGWPARPTNRGGAGQNRNLGTRANQGESSSGHGRVPSVEEAAEWFERQIDRQIDGKEKGKGKRD
ncbi:hypothetical protein F511_29080 [Dorcoceras hygrometricum]|uniref:Uncharacterized protein n=1 Tax=Dorcoceras hygrometricum TaxID=472368 RepID=A0A2Z7BIE8_9LAMI|nr:hypothetical protein F511_29080 [Dorcoceras hygrometricum]